MAKSSVAFKRSLNPEQEKALAVDYEDGWTTQELSVMYLISVRTVYRILADQGAKRRSKKTRKKRKPSYSKAPKEPKPCGTNAAYQRHRTNNEYPCSACLEAHTADVKRYKDRT